MSDAAFQSSANSAPTLAPRSRDELDDVLDVLTRRLEIDPELRLEVRQELRSHLEESIAQYRQAGQDETAARSEAVLALGNPEDLSEALWRSNRRRIRLRAAATWAARLVLPPVAAAIIVVLMAHALTAWAMVSWHEIGGWLNWTRPPYAHNIIETYREQALSRVQPDVRPLFEYGADAAREALDKHPDDPSLYAHYAQAMLLPGLYKPHYDPFPARHEPQFSQAIAALAEGERREPDNAFYPMMTATLLLDAAVKPGAEEPKFEKDRYGGDYHVEVTDRAGYEQALAALHRAAQKPYFRLYNAEVAQRKLAELPADSVSQLWVRARVESDSRSNALYYLWNFWFVAVAREDVFQGQTQQAEQIVRDMKIVCGLMAQSAENVDQLQEYIVLSNAMNQVGVKLPGATTQMSSRLEEWNRTRAHDSTDWWKRSGALHASYGGPWVEGVPFDMAAMRRAEYAAGDQLTLLVVAAVVFALACSYAIVASLVRLGAATKTSDSAGSNVAALPPSPGRLWIGWKHASSIVLLGVVLPVGLYLGYAMLTPFAGREFGIQVTAGRVVGESAVLLAVVVTALMLLCRRAVRRRAAELGLLPAKPSDRHHRRRISSVALATAGALLVGAACTIGAMLSVLRRGTNITPLSVSLQALTLLLITVGLTALALRPRRLDREMALLAAFVISGVIALQFAWRGAEWFAPPVRWVGPFLMLSAAWALLAAAGLALRARDPGEGAEANFGAIIARSSFPVVLLAALVLALVALPLRWTERRAALMASGGGGSHLLFLNKVDQTPFAPIRAKLIEQRESLLKSAPQ